MTLLERLQLAACHAVHGPDIDEAVNLIKEQRKLLELWADYYVNGLHPDDIQNLYIDTLATMEDES